MGVIIQTMNLNVIYHLILINRKNATKVNVRYLIKRKGK